MKKNFPVTTQQVSIAPDISLVSKTDLKGIITYANEAFVETSGFSLEELLGESHNIVRHPDMPAEVFADMWQLLKQGKPWQGIIKNRCKSGDFYWVDACVVPIRRNDQTIGYMSVRTYASPTAITETLVTHQHIATTGQLPKVWKLPACLGIRFGMRAGTIFVAAMMLAGGALGIGGLHMADAAFTRMYQQQFEPATAVGDIETRLQSIRATVLEAQLALQTHSHTGNSANNSPATTDNLLEQLQSDYDDIGDLFQTLERQTLNAESGNKALVKALRAYTEQGHKLAQQVAINHTIPSEVLLQLQHLGHNASLSAQALRHALTDAAQQEITATLERNAHIRNIAIAGIALGLLIVAAVGHFFIRGIVHPLNAAIRRLNRIAEGNLQDPIDLSGTGETAQLNHAATVMQQHLKVMLDEIALAARRIHRHCKTLNQALYEVTEHSEAQHDQVYSALRALDTAVTETIGLSSRAERLLEMASSQHSELADETRELATATRLTAFGAEEVADSMRQVAELIVQNRGEAQLAWQASEKLIHTARELNNLVDFFDPHKAIPNSSVANTG